MAEVSDERSKVICCVWFTVIFAVFGFVVPRAFAQSDYGNVCCAGRSFCGDDAGHKSLGKSLCTRDTLTADVWGARPWLARRGMTYDAELTHFYQGVCSGGQQQVFKYGGKLDQFVLFDFGKLGLSKRLKAIMHAETRFGESVISDAAVLTTVNVNMLYPRWNADETAITGFHFDYEFIDQWSLIAGKINALDMFCAIYPQLGRGVDGFMNASVMLPFTTGETIPLSFLGAGVLKRRGPQIQGGFLVYDSNSSTTTSGFDVLFDNGANIGGLWRFFTNFGGLPGSHLVLGTWASGRVRTFNSLIPDEIIFECMETGSWNLQYFIEQRLWADSRNENRNIGLLSIWGLADPKKNPFEWVGNVQFQGQGLFLRREQDTMGVGYFYSGISDDFKIAHHPSLILKNAQGVEIYYNAAITPWSHLSADLQFVESANSAADTAIVFALRLKIDL